MRISNDRDRKAREFFASLEAAENVTRTNEAYKIARRTTTNQNWDPDPVAANTAILGAQQLGIARVREQIRNNPLFKGALATLIDLTIGVGIRAFSFPFVPIPGRSIGSGDILQAWLDSMVRDEDLIYAYESDWWFRRWASDPEQCDFEGKLTWFDIERLAFSEAVAEGNGILIKCQRRDRRKRLIPFCVQLIEREQLDRSMDRPASTDRNKIVGGLEFDRDNRLVGAHVLEDHPDDWYYQQSDRSRFIPASRILHAFLPDRPSADLGFTQFGSVAQHSRDRDWLMGSLLTNAALQSLLTIVHKKENFGQGGTINLDGDTILVDDSTTPRVKWKTGGHVVEIPNTDDVQAFQSSQPPPGLADFTNVIDRDSARGLPLSELRYTGSWKELSYTAGRGSMLDDEMHHRPLREWWGRKISLPVRRLVSDQMALTEARGGRRRYSTVTAANYLDQIERYQEYLVIGPGREMLDPEGETDASLAKIRSGLSSLILEGAKQGLHWFELLTQTRLVNTVADRMGITLDFTKQQGGKAESTTTATGGNNQRNGSSNSNS